MDDMDNPDYCDMNHNGQDHEWTLFRVVVKRNKPELDRRVLICKYCGTEQPCEAPADGGKKE